MTPQTAAVTLSALAENALVATDAFYDLAVAMERPDNPAVEARLIVRDGLRDVREWLGETTPEAEDYKARHAEDGHIVPMLWRAAASNA